VWRNTDALCPPPPPIACSQANHRASCPPPRVCVCMDNDSVSLQLQEEASSKEAAEGAKEGKEDSKL